MDSEMKSQIALVASLAALVVAGLALGWGYSATQAPVAREAAALRGNNDYLRFQIEQFKVAIPQLQNNGRAELADAVRLMENVIYAFENEGNPDRDPTKPGIAEAVGQAQGRIAEWSQ